MSFNRGLWRMNGKPLGNTPVTPWRIMPSGPVSSGPTLPPSPQIGQRFVHTPPNRKFYLIYDGTQWDTLFSFGTTNLYVDGTNGTDAQGNGWGTGTAAFKTIQFATNQLLGCQMFGNGTINAAAGTYNETVTIQGIAFAGNYSLTYKGARAADTLGDTTGMTWADAAGNGSAGWTTITSGGTPWTAHAFQNKWLEMTSGTGGGQVPVLVHDNTTSVITIAGSLGDMGFTVGDVTTHFHIFGNASIIDAQSTRAYGVNVLGVQGVVLNQMTVQNATVLNVACGNLGVLTLTNGLIQSSALFNVEIYGGSQTGTISGCAFLSAGNTEFVIATGAQVLGIQGCRFAGSTANAVGLSLQTGGGLNALLDSYLSETGAGGVGINTTLNSNLGFPNNYLEVASCNSHGILNDTGSRIVFGAGGATNRVRNNGGWGLLSQNGATGAGVNTASASWSGNTSGNFSPVTTLAGGNS